MIYVGEQDCGYFAEEVANVMRLSFDYIPSNIHIESQINEIMKLGKQDFTIFDVSQYVDDVESIARNIVLICNANGSKPIVFASGFYFESAMLVAAIEQGIKLYITGSSLSVMKDQLTKCLNGFYEANGIDDISTFQNEIAKEQETLKNVRMIGVAGACKRIGTTTHAVQLIRYLQLKGYKACYIQLNNTSYVHNLSEWLEISSSDDEIGRITYGGVDHFYKMERLGDIVKLNYDYIVYDYGVYFDKDFNRVSFMEKDIRIFVVGSDPEELPNTYNIIKSAFYDDIRYIFNFSSEQEADDLKELMGEKFSNTFIAGFIPDKYIFVPEPDIYERILPLKNVSDETKRKGFWRKKK